MAEHGGIKTGNVTNKMIGGEPRVAMYGRDIVTLAVALAHK